MGRYSAAARKARNQTNKQLGDEISALGPMTRDKLKELLPKKRDKEQFVELMKIVESEKSDDEKLASLTANVQTLGGVALKALKLLI